MTNDMTGTTIINAIADEFASLIVARVRYSFEARFEAIEQDMRVHVQRVDAAIAEIAQNAGVPHAGNIITITDMAKQLAELNEQVEKLGGAIDDVAHEVNEKATPRDIERAFDNLDLSDAINEALDYDDIASEVVDKMDWSDHVREALREIIR
jgi:MoaA/NifB/PqqE/SkfB family radical SAM enzyme